MLGVLQMFRPTQHVAKNMKTIQYYKKMLRKGGNGQFYLPAFLAGGSIWGAIAGKHRAGLNN